MLDKFRFIAHLTEVLGTRINYVGAQKNPVAHALMWFSRYEYAWLKVQERYFCPYHNLSFILTFTKKWWKNTYKQIGFLILSLITNPQMTSILSLTKGNIIKIARVNGKMFKIDVIYGLKGTKQNKKWTTAFIVREG